MGDTSTSSRDASSSALPACAQLLAMREALRRQIFAQPWKEHDAPHVVAKDLAMNFMQQQVPPATMMTAATTTTGPAQPQQHAEAVEAANLAALQSLLVKENLLWLTRLSHKKSQKTTTAAASPTTAKTPREQLLHCVQAATKEWRALMSVRVESVKILHMLSSNSNNNARNDNVASTGTQPGAAGGGGDGGTSNAQSASSQCVEVALLPAGQVDDLFQVLVERANSTAVAQRLPAKEPRVDNMGFFSVFTAHVHALVEAAGLVPSVQDLRAAFSELDPSENVQRSCAHYTQSSIALSDESFQSVLQSGEDPDALCSLAMRGVAPSMRRLVYARLLQLSLTVAGAPSASAAASAGSATTTGPAATCTGGSSTAAAAAAAGVFPQQQETTLSTGSVPPCRTRAVRFASLESVRSVLHASSAMSKPQPEGTLQILRSMMQSDINSTVGDNDKYFVFQDEVALVGYALLADSGVMSVKLADVLKQEGREEELSNYHVSIGASVESTASRGGDGPSLNPPMGFVPLASSSALIAPLCYATADLSELFEISRCMLGQLWCRIQCPSLELVSMCTLFETLTARHAPAAVLHCFTKLNTPPLRVTLPWMLSGFAKLLEPNEALALWDTLLAAHCMSCLRSRRTSPFWLLAVLAASIFSLRGGVIQLCQTMEQVTRVFEDGLKLRAVPLMQHMMFLMS